MTRPDVVGFVNGIPLVFMELKKPSVKLRAAFEKNLKDYKNVIPRLFHFNAVIILSNGLESKIGSITSSLNILVIGNELPKKRRVLLVWIP